MGTQANSAANTTTESKAYNWTLQAYGLLGSARQGNTGGGIEGAYCIKLDTDTCMEVGAGMSIVAGGPDFYRPQKALVSRGEISWTPLTRLAFTHFPVKSFGFGVVGNLGYSIRKGSADWLDTKNPLDPSNFNKPYSGNGVMLNGLLSFYLKPSQNFGFHFDGGIQSPPKSDLPGDRRQTGIIGQAGLKLWL